MSSTMVLLHGVFGGNVLSHWYHSQRLNLCANRITEDPVVCVQVATQRSLAVIAMDNLRDTGSNL